jgi:hypothetical protein
VLGVGVVGVGCKPKGMCGVVAILGVSCQLNTMTRTLLRVLKKKKSLMYPEFVKLVLCSILVMVHDCHQDIYELHDT